MNIRISFTISSIATLLTILCSCGSREQYYSAGDFTGIPKIDAHFHYLTMDSQYLKFASSLNLRLLNPNWDGEYSIDEQLRISEAMRQTFPHNFAFFGTFSVNSYGTPGFSEETIERIKYCLAKGASGIKIWKNIGMVLKDGNGKYVMIDDPALAPVLDYLEKNRIPVMGHLGEPRDCWLPENEMIDPGAVIYFKEHPQYYMYLHPEAPSYESQITARDNILERYPKIDFIGAHLASLEWSLTELAKRLDNFPNLKVDIAARMGPILYHSGINRDEVRDFMIKYQDRILYGTDFEVHDEPGLDPEKVMENLRKGWLDQWIYFATDSTVEVKGLKLPKEVIDKIYFRNAEKYFL